MDPKKSRVPEIAMMYNRSRGEDKTRELVDDNLIDFLKDIKDSSGIEIMGRLGFISEYLSRKGNTVRLIDEERMFFVYRGHIFKNSNVIEMNIHPNNINPSVKYYDFAIVHSDEFLELAKQIADTVYHVERMEVYKNEKVTVDNNENEGELSENEGNEKSDRKDGHNDPDSNIPDSIEY